jgi:hypothetical protein
MRRLWFFITICSGIVLLLTDFAISAAAENSIPQSQARTLQVTSQLFRLTQVGNNAPVSQATTHYPQSCSACHASPSQCADCHQGDQPARHFNVECSSCHQPGAWKTVNFDHQAINTTECVACHGNTQPAGHFSLPCSNCHTPGAAWQSAKYNHSGAKDCGSCHKPALGHFNNGCARCHSYPNWSNIDMSWHTFGEGNHKFGGCSSCHPGQDMCASCHDGNEGKD